MMSPSLRGDKALPHTAPVESAQEPTAPEPAKLHHAKCLCLSCERISGGYFAQRRALEGDPSAARYLSHSVFAILGVERAERLREATIGPRGKAPRSTAAEMAVVSTPS